jgi:hypothetical protein
LPKDGGDSGSEDEAARTDEEESPGGCELSPALLDHEAAVESLPDQRRIDADAERERAGVPDGDRNESASRWKDRLDHGGGDREGAGTGRRRGCGGRQ